MVRTRKMSLLSNSQRRFEEGLADLFQPVEGPEPLATAPAGWPKRATFAG